MAVAIVKKKPNGHAAAQFSGRRVQNYRRPYGRWWFHPALKDGRFSCWDVPAMLTDNAVTIGLYTIYGPMFGAEFEVRANSPDIKKFVENTLYRFWHHDLMKVLQHYITTGTSVAEVLYEIDQDTGLWRYAGMDDFDMNDVQALRKGRNLSGARVSYGSMLFSTPSGSGLGRRYDAATGKDLPPTEWNVIRHPKVFWCAHRPLCGELFGQSALGPSWNPWMEKVGAHGAISIRKLWAFSNAFRGVVVKYPPGGTYSDEKGKEVDHQDIVRELAENYCTGAAEFCPSGSDEHGKPLWEIIDPALNGEIRGLMEYPEALDRGIWQGMGVLDEVIHAPDTGGSWSGRSGPLLVFLNIADMRVREIVTAFDVGPSGYTTRNEESGGVIRPLVMENFGPNARYQIIPISLVPKPQEPGAGGSEQSAPGAAMGAAPQDAQQQQPMPVPMGGAAPAQQAMGQPVQAVGDRPVQLSSSLPTSIVVDLPGVTVEDVLMTATRLSSAQEPIELSAGRYAVRAADAADKTPDGDHRHASYAAAYATHQAMNSNTSQAHVEASDAHKRAWAAHKRMSTKTVGDSQAAHHDAMKNHAAAAQHHTSAAKAMTSIAPITSGVRPVTSNGNPFHHGADMRVMTGGREKVAIDKMRRQVQSGSMALSGLFDADEHPHDARGRFSVKAIKDAKKALRAGKLAVQKSDEPIRSDASGHEIHNHVELDGGQKIHPDELHRMKERDGEMVLHPDEGLNVHEPSGKTSAKSFPDALVNIAVGGKPTDPVTIVSKHGYSATRPRSEWKETGYPRSSASFSSWYDNGGHEHTGRQVEGGPSATMGTEDETADFFKPKGEQGGLYKWDTPNLPESTGGSKLLFSAGHDVSGEARNDSGEWTTGGNSHASHEPANKPTDKENDHLDDIADKHDVPKAALWKRVVKAAGRLGLTTAKILAGLAYPAAFDHDNDSVLPRIWDAVWGQGREWGEPGDQGLFLSGWDSSLHPRGHEGNKGEFAEKHSVSSALGDDERSHALDTNHEHDDFNRGLLHAIAQKDPEPGGSENYRMGHGLGMARLMDAANPEAFDAVMSDPVKTMAVADQVAENFLEKPVSEKMKSPVKWMKEKAQEQWETNKKKYGYKGALAIWAAGQAITWGASVGLVSAALPPIPFGGGLITSAALSVMIDQWKKIRGGDKQPVELSAADEAEVKALDADELYAEFREKFERMLGGVA